MITHWISRAIASGVAIVCISIGAGCAPSPRNLPCANDGECEKGGTEFRYCLESRCVECVGSASCGDGNTCVDGRCERKCRDERDCPTKNACVQSQCAHL
jgi:peptidoglycan-associated lipoprotein